MQAFTVAFDLVSRGVDSAALPEGMQTSLDVPVYAHSPLEARQLAETTVNHAWYRIARIRMRRG